MNSRICAVCMIGALFACGDRDDGGATGPTREQSESDGDASLVPLPSEVRRTLIFDRVAAELGTLHQGDDSSAEFHYHNYADRPIHVRSFRGSCKCISATLDAEIVQPGQEGVATVTFHSAGRHGTEVGSAHLRSDAPDADPIVFSLRVDTRVPLDPVATVINLELREPGDLIEDRIAVRTLPEVPSWSARSLSGDVLQLRSDPIEDRKSWLHYRFVVPEKLGTHGLDLELESTLSDPWLGKVVHKPMMITWQVLSPVKCLPDRLVIGSEPVSFRVIRQWERAETSISAHASCDALRVSLVRERDKALIFEVVATDLEALPEDARVVIETGHEAQPRVELPVVRGPAR